MTKQRAWQKRNPEKVRAAINKLRRKKQDIIDAARNRPCMDCGQSFPLCCMDFDHRDPATKFREVSHLRYCKTETIEAEMAKCDVVCSNCHRIRTSNRLHGLME